MTTISGQIKGSKLLEEGYEKDSMGLPIDPGAYYEYEGVKWCGLDVIYRAALPRPKKLNPPIKKNEH